MEDDIKNYWKTLFLRLKNAQDINKDVQYMMSFNYILGIRTVKGKFYFAKALTS